MSIAIDLSDVIVDVGLGVARKPSLHGDGTGCLCCRKGDGVREIVPAIGRIVASGAGLVGAFASCAWAARVQVLSETVWKAHGSRMGSDEGISVESLRLIGAGAEERAIEDRGSRDHSPAPSSVRSSRQADPPSSRLPRSNATLNGTPAQTMTVCWKVIVCTSPPLFRNGYAREPAYPKLR